MKKLLAITAAAAVMAVAGTAMAADTNTLTVQASVTGTCKFVTNSSTLDFGALDPASGANVTKSASTKFWCTKGVAESSTIFTANDGLHISGTTRRMAGATGGDFIPYELSLSKDGLTNGGPTLERDLTITGSVNFDDYKSVTATTYSDTVVISYTP